MKRLAVLALAFLLSGCSFSFPFSSSTPEIHYYVLDAPSPSGWEASTPRLGVMPISMPGYLSRPQLVVREKDGVSIRVLDFDRWGEELASGVTRVLCDALSAQGVSAVPLITGSQADAKLMLDIRRLDGRLDGEVTLDAVWTIQKGKNVYRTGHVIRTTTCEDDIVSMVEAQSNLIQTLAKEIARSVK